ncbi:hypothetical protein [Radiobacillus sp. PE A8.2]|uniref:hypothetical protein n=1 Tax=Radiobacillus sp. PE A8.2 TaxID=3380349 RepID=UPI003890D54C
MYDGINDSGITVCFTIIEEVENTLLIKFKVALLSTFLSSLILTLVFHDSLGNGFLLFLPITGGAYILGGITCSILIDKWTTKNWIKFFYFIIAGFVVGILTILVFILTLSPPSNGYSIDLSTIKNGMIFGVYGSIGALVFYVIDLLLKGLKKKGFN